MLVDIGGAAGRWMELKIKRCLQNDECVALFLLDEYEGRQYGSDNKERTETSETILPLAKGNEGVASARYNLHNIPCICGSTTTCDCYNGNSLNVEQNLTASFSDSALLQSNLPIKIEVNDVGNKSQYESLKQGVEGNILETQPEEKSSEFQSETGETNSTKQTESLHEENDDISNLILLCETNSMEIEKGGDSYLSKAPSPIKDPSYMEKESLKKCSTCQKYFKAESLHQHQILEHPERKIFPCHLCPRNFEVLGFLQTHLKKTHQFYELELDAEILPKATSPKPIDPCNMKKGITYLKCSTCNQYFRGGSLTTHKIIEHAEKRIHACHLCPQTFEHVGRLRSHLTKVHSAGKEVTKHLIQKGKSPLSVHPSKVNKKLHTKCSTCQQYFSCGSLTTHKQLEHPELRIHKCRKCSRTFEHVGRLRNHFKKYHGRGHLKEVEPVCPEPSKTALIEPPTGENDDFSASILLSETNSSEMDQGEVGNFPKISSQPPNHSGSEIDYLSTLKGKSPSPIHPSKVDKEKDRKCSTCHQYFTSGSLTTHKKLEHPELRIHKCHTCSRTFEHVGRLRTHVKKYHDPNQVSNVIHLKEVEPIHPKPLNTALIEPPKKVQQGENDDIPAVIFPTETNSSEMDQREDDDFSNAPSQSPNPHTSEIDYLSPLTGKSPSPIHPSKVNKETDRKCSTCHKYFNAGSLTTHKQLEHPDRRIFHCPVCSIIFEHVGRLQTHLQKFHPAHEHEINDLSVPEFTSPPPIHPSKVDKEKDKKCSTCHQYFSPGRLLLHKKLEHAELRIHKCCKCDRTFEHEGRLRIHLQKFHPEAKFEKGQPVLKGKSPTPIHPSKVDKARHRKCSTCKKYFKGGLDRHKQLEHPELRIFKCKICLSTFEHVGRLRTHVKKSHGGNNVRNARQTRQAPGKRGDSSNNYCDNSVPKIPIKTEQDEGLESIQEGTVDKAKDKANFCDTNLFQNVDELGHGKHQEDTSQTNASSIEIDNSKNIDNTEENDCRKEVDNIKKVGNTKEVDSKKENNTEQNQEKHKADTGYTCGVCALSFTTKKELNKHKKSAGHGEVCYICGWSCSTFGTLRSHMETHLAPYNCQLCTNVFRSKLALSKHILVTHQRKQQPWKCRDCGYPVATAMLRQASYNCPQCGLDLANIKGAVMKSDEEIKAHVCDLCGKGYSQANGLRGHIRAAHSNQEKTFRCDQCDYKSFTKFVLTRHIQRVHLKNHQTISCPHCPKMVGSKSQLKRHILCHTGLKPYKCSVSGCTSSYKDNTNLKIHMKNIHNMQI